MENNNKITYRKELIKRYWRYQESKFNPVDRYFDQPNNNNKRPPVFHQKKLNRNLLTSPDTESMKNEQLIKLLPSGEHHKWYHSMNSSQALTLSILGNLFIHNHLSILSQLLDDEGQPLLASSDILFEKLCMEHKINHLCERRRTSVDAFIPGNYQVAIECKFTENDFGSCSRPRLTKCASNFEKDYCNGTYTRQSGRQERCSLTASRVKYWEFVPVFFKWDKINDLNPCPLRYNYQLVRNILAAGIKKDMPASPANGQVILIYDMRNPACHPGGKIYKSYIETKEALQFPKMLKKISWQSIINFMREENLLLWLTEELNEKYGL